MRSKPNIYLFTSKTVQVRNTLDFFLRQLIDFFDAQTPRRVCLSACWSVRRATHALSPLLFIWYLCWVTNCWMQLTTGAHFLCYILEFIYLLFSSICAPLLALALQRLNARTFIRRFVLLQIRRYGQESTSRKRYLSNCSICAGANALFHICIWLCVCVCMYVGECSLGMCNCIRANEMAEVAVNCLLSCVIVPVGHTLCRQLE